MPRDDRRAPAVEARPTPDETPAQAPDGDAVEAITSDATEAPTGRRREGARPADDDARGDDEAPTSRRREGDDEVPSGRRREAARTAEDEEREAEGARLAELYSAKRGRAGDCPVCRRRMQPVAPRVVYCAACLQHYVD